MNEVIHIQIKENFKGLLLNDRTYAGMDRECFCVGKVNHAVPYWFSVTNSTQKPNYFMVILCSPILRGLFFTTECPSMKIHTIRRRELFFTKEKFNTTPAFSSLVSRTFFLVGSDDRVKRKKRNLYLAKRKRHSQRTHDQWCHRVYS